MTSEAISLDADQQAAYDAAWSCLGSDANFLAPIPSVVSTSLNLPDANEEQPITLVTPTRGHHALFKALEQLEGLEKEEQTLLEHAELSQQLTQIILQETFVDSRQALQRLQVAGATVPRRVCQHPFRKNDIVWVCRTCQADETCVLCHNCYSQSDHEGHDVAFYHAQAGGCCDCGDPDAWDPSGFCPNHGPNSRNSSPDSPGLPAGLVHRVRGVVPAAVDWMVQSIASNAEEAYLRAHPKKSTDSMRKMPSMEASSTPPQAASHHRSQSMPSHSSDDEMEIDDDDILSDVDTDFPFLAAETSLRRAQVFSPDAASTGRSHREDHLQRQDENAEELGLTGAAGHGLYLVLHADDIHSNAQVVEALRSFLGSSNYYTDTLLTKLFRALKLYGQLVVWGTMEIAANVGVTQVQLWMDGDKVASTRIGAVLLERASRLTKHGMFCSILTRDELILEQRAVALLQWLSAVARSCDPLCQTVAECILPNRHLVPLLRADFKMSARVTKAWYSLLLTLLAVPAFKSHLAAAYCDTYRSVTAKYARGMGVLERSGYTLSVQFLNRVTYVVDLVQGRDLLGKLGKSLLETLLVANRPSNLNGRLNPNHFVLTHRRYSPCISDLKCVLNVKGMPRLIACSGGTFLEDWVEALSAAQFMNPQYWRHWTQGHVEEESRGWVGAFNASISLGSLFERLLGWEDEEVSPIKDPSSPLSHGLMPCVEMTYHIMANGLAKWQRSEMLFYESTPYTGSFEPHKRCPASLPFSCVAAKRGTALAMRQLPVSQVTGFSFHLPLHRFVAGCLRELCLRKDDEQCGMTNLLHRLRIQLSESDSDELFRGLLEFPVLVLSRAAQVRAGLWRRNGPGLNDQVLNYAEPPFCRTMRDADLLLTQFAVLGRVQHQSSLSRPVSDIGMAFFVNLLLHRLGVFDFAGLCKAPSWNITGYAEEVDRGLYPREAKAEDVMEDDLTLPWTYSPTQDASPSLVLLEEFAHILIVFVSELPHMAPQDKRDCTRQAEWRLYREVLHRLASGPKTHSELSEVHHVLSHRDNVLLSEEGKKVNPDDATGAALGKVLEEIADRKISRGKLEPEKWELKRSAWEYYDPAFYHISLRSHQTAAEGRPKPPSDPNSAFGWDPRPYAPVPNPAHPFFQRLPRDLTADATVLSVVHRILHMHCRENTDKSVAEVPGSLAYESKEKSETALARAVHLLTLGAYAWRDANAHEQNWRDMGGGSVGSVFADRPSYLPAPEAGDWISKALLASPSELTDCDWYIGEECTLLLLRRLAFSGGVPGGFIAQDAAVRSGAAWLCEFAEKKSSEAASLLSPAKVPAIDNASEEKVQSDIDKRKSRAKEAAMAKMKAQAAKFASMMEMELGDEEDEREEAIVKSPAPLGSPVRTIRAASFGSNYSSASSGLTPGDNEAGGLTQSPQFSSSDSFGFSQTTIPLRLLKARPRCIICNDEEGSEGRSEIDDGESQRKKSKRRTENALGFVGYSQASTVLKGGGGPPAEPDSALSPVREFVGAHVALCGHAVHSECCESYLATVSHREERVIGKRDEFRCPLCQRLSNCLIPFIDVGVDWIESPICLPIGASDKAMIRTKSEEDPDAMHLVAPMEISNPVSLHDFLTNTPWWVTRHSTDVVWDGQSAFVDQSTLELPDSEVEVTQTRRKGRRRYVRSLKKRDLYAAWNSMMRTPRFVRRRLRPRGMPRDELFPSTGVEAPLTPTSETVESAGETIVWRRFMDQISDITYRADSKRLGDDHLHDLFGEFRHYIVEKYAYNMAGRFIGSEPVDWPSCMFSHALPDNRKQEMSREKLLSKLLLSIKGFTYSVCCETFEAKRMYRKSLAASSKVAGSRQDPTIESVFSRFGIGGMACDGKLVVMPRPSSQIDEGSQPFSGRLGKLRYVGLAAMAAAGAVAADLVQLVMPFPLLTKVSDDSLDDETPERAPIAYPLLFGNVLTHVVTAMCATCGRGRARSDSLDLVWPVPFSSQGSFVFSEDFVGSEKADSVVEDCEAFLKLGLLAKMLQVLLGRLRVPASGFKNPRAAAADFQSLYDSFSTESASAENAWMRCCVKLLEVALSNQNLASQSSEAGAAETPSIEVIREACSLASTAACSFLADAGTILQVLLPGVVLRYDSPGGELPGDTRGDGYSSYDTFVKLQHYFKVEPLEEILQSPLVLDVVSDWYDTACRHAKVAESLEGLSDTKATLRIRLYRTQGYRVYDWPSAGTMESLDVKPGARHKILGREHPEDGMVQSSQVENILSPSSQTSTAEVVREQTAPTLVTFSSKKTVPLLGGFTPDFFPAKAEDRPRVAVMPTSYTDLYAELGTLLPDCEQTAVCLICGEVLNAGGKGECTRHSYKCGAGTGMFFLLQECSGLIMHKSKAAYIHSPYVDSHGETPQYRGRPLNLDLDRYEHLREVWYGHAVRQQVVAERGSSRQVILPDFY